jgi:CheY-like chemotaxis protein
VSGWELAAELRAEEADLKVVFVSGYSAEHAQQEVVLQPGQKFLQKPFSPYQVLETVRQCLDS